ncbi:hypothetical protein PACTADRAFT_47965 [Pachysolen tannophilus NRRL Y-2460]|uniref:Mitochondrial 15S rRNA processing factor CCM1 n=1 Tax=Pachysolen tannophilus NRRL Y-2460 TaxID=669874 RepID=A0A1E4U2F1_PACTA|nr:hypothetical protein PACTADRAFT_47965 [Pachysolen tannophilus NRRL Y-2460]
MLKCIARQRAFSTGVVLSGRVKGLLRQNLNSDQFTNEKVIFNSKQLKAKQRRKELYLREKKLKPFTKSTANEILKKKLNIAIDEKIGPTVKLEDEQLKEIFKTSNKRLIYSVLGTSGEQLKDSEIVEKDVLKFLSRNDLNKAIYLSRLAGTHGIVAMNRILNYLLVEQQDANGAISLFNFRKKWGVPPNEHTFTILFDGLSKISKPLNEKILIKILNIFNGTKEKNPELISIIHVNSLLSALTNSSDLTHAFKFFQELPTEGKLKAENKTFTILFKGLSQAELDDDLCIERANLFWKALTEKLTYKAIDSKLIQSYASVFLTRSNLKYISYSLTILNNWFEICDEDKRSQVFRYSESHKFKYNSHSKTIELLSIEEINPFKTRFELNKAALDLYLQGLNKLGLYKEAVHVYQTYVSKIRDTADIELFNNFLKNYTKSSKVKKELINKDVEINPITFIYNQLSDLNLKPNGFTNYIIFNFLDDQILQNMNEMNQDKALQFLKLLREIDKFRVSNFTRNNLIDSFKLCSRLADYLTKENLVDILRKDYFENYELTNLMPLLTNHQEIKHSSIDIKKIKTIEIKALSLLKKINSILDQELSQLKKGDVTSFQKTTLEFNSINRVKNSINENLKYIDNYILENNKNFQDRSDPEFKKLKEIELEKKASIRSYKILVLKDENEKKQKKKKS